MNRSVRGRVGIRVRLLGIVLISSVTLLVIGVGAAGYLVKSGKAAQDWADLAASTTTPSLLMVNAFQEERRVSLLHLAGDPTATAMLSAAREHSDQALAAVMAKGDAARKLNPEGAAADYEGYNQLYAQLPVLRSGIDSGQTPPDQVFGSFSKVIETIIESSMLAARVAPDAGVAVDLGYGVGPLRAAEALSRADTIGAVALTTGELPPARLVDFTRYVGEYRGEVVYASTVLHGARLTDLNNITSGPAWPQVTAMEDAIIVRGAVHADGSSAQPGASTTDDSTRSGESSSRSHSVPPKPALPLNPQAWQSMSAQIGSALMTLWENQTHDAHAVARGEGDRIARNSLLGGAAVLVVSVLAFVAALVLANRFIGRMRRLRRDTLELADQRLPELMDRLGRGEDVDLETQVDRLDFGTDELGHVADAFNRAHMAAVSAAVAESRTRAGINAVFLNIAHRSQVVVHRQLALLDQAERKEENADQLELLFQLDHLATRARRNAENLIILGGEQPGRRWRQAVPLIELVRGAVAESLDYTRISTGRVPDVRVASKAVADLIHLMAELMDNATAFSPPQARVEVSATVVGRGVAVEIVDQGLGMPEAELAERNEVLADPPEFSVATLSSDARLGLFVVAKLARRHGISVRLGESDYGGVRAVVLIPAAIIEAAEPADEPRAGQEIAAPEEPKPVVRPAPEFRPRPRRHEADTGSSVWFTPAPNRSRENSASDSGGDSRPPLPRRRRGSGPSIGADGAVESDAAPVRQRSADEARQLMSAIETGTRQARANRTEFGTGADESDHPQVRGGDDDGAGTG
ncbi:sensor histidine kinase [Nocardia terpenica]|uniref:sensor histidine kinase n=1 Tax=Nocardia terpenica TaxID=455432 RepID=UPI002B4B6050|nr:nitrate- and nitrite sensing domain-containing protein [Nocardia terpenica]